MISRKIILI